MKRSISWIWETRGSTNGGSSHRPVAPLFTAQTIVILRLAERNFGKKSWYPEIRKVISLEDMTHTILIDGFLNAKKVDEAFMLVTAMKKRNVSLPAKPVLDH